MVATKPAIPPNSNRVTVPDCDLLSIPDEPVTDGNVSERLHDND